MPESSIQRAVLRGIEVIKPPARSRILDLSCGDGAIIESLAAKGYTVEGTHFRADDYIFHNPSPILNTAAIHTGIDLTRPLPFESASFDVVLATEVLEHLPAHTSIIEEIGRILVNGGHFIFTTPNIHRLSSRLQFLLTGTHDLSGARLGWHVPREELYSTHMNPVYFPVLHGLLHQNQLRIRRLMFSSMGLLSLTALIPLYPILALATTVEARHFWKRSRAGGKDILRWLLDPRMLLSKQLVGVAVKFDG